MNVAHLSRQVDDLRRRVEQLETEAGIDHTVTHHDAPRDAARRASETREASAQEAADLRAAAARPERTARE